MSRLVKVLVPVVAAPVAVAAARGAARARRAVAEAGEGVPTPTPSVGLAAAAAADALITMPMGLLASTGSAADHAESSVEVDRAVAFYRDRGWLDDPRGRHAAPPGGALDVEEGPPGRRTVAAARFESGWEPVEGEPGGERWRSFVANRVAVVRLLEHPGGPRPWLVAVHGQGMGRPGDHRMLRVHQVHHELGVNVALPVLPLHGPRTAGFRPHEQFVSNVFPVNNVLGVAQSVWELRRLIEWLRADRGAQQVGVLGLSLGSYVCSALATVEPELACVVAVVPQPDLAGSLRAARPTIPAKRRLHDALYDERVDLLHRPVSPLAAACLVPRDRRFIVAGQVDGIADPRGAARLWRHWDEPSILWRPRGHLTANRSQVFDSYLAAALMHCGLGADVTTRSREDP